MATKKPLKILIVEDDLIAQKVARLTLVKLGHDVDVAGDGDQAIEFFKQQQYDFIFMDIGLPRENGMEVTRKLREIEPNEQHVPIVALTANYDMSHKPACLESGMDEFMLKPLTGEKATEIFSKFNLD